MKFIGDVHARFSAYHDIIDSCTDSIQIGDLGVGFYHSNGNPAPNPSWDKMVKNNHRWLRGNHDSPSAARTHSQWIPDGHTETTPRGQRMMVVGGSWSIDRPWRTEGFDWWPDEEVSYKEFEAIFEKYKKYQPDIMVTHDFPEQVAYELFLQNSQAPIYRTRTGQALQAMFDYHKPKIWLGGHWHLRRDRNIDGTRFICLEELGTIDLDI